MKYTRTQREFLTWLALFLGFETFGVVAAVTAKLLGAW